MDTDGSALLTPLVQVVLLDNKWLVNLIVKEDWALPAIDKIILDVNKIFDFVQSFSIESAPQHANLPTIRFYHETVVHAGQRLKSSVVEMIRTALKLDIRQDAHVDITIKNLLRHKLDLSIQMCVEALRKLLYAVKRDPFTPAIGKADPAMLARHVLLSLRQWGETHSTGQTTTATIQEWKDMCEEKRVMLETAMNAVRNALQTSIFNLLDESNELSNLIGLLEQLGRRMLLRPGDAVASNQIEATMLEAVDFVRRILPFLRREVACEATGDDLLIAPINSADYVAVAPQLVQAEGDDGEDSAPPSPVVLPRLQTQPTTTTTTTEVAAQQAAVVAQQQQLLQQQQQQQQQLLEVKLASLVSLEESQKMQQQQQQHSPVASPPQQRIATESTTPSSSPLWRRSAILRPSESPAGSPQQTRPSFLRARQEPPTPTTTTTTTTSDHTPATEQAATPSPTPEQTTTATEQAPTPTPTHTPTPTTETPQQTVVAAPKSVIVIVPSHPRVHTDVPQIEEGDAYVLEKIGKQSKRFETTFTVGLEHAENHFGYYGVYFYGQDHLNYIGNVYDLGGPVIISICRNMDLTTKKYHVLIRTKTADARSLVSVTTKGVNKFGLPYPKPAELYNGVVQMLAPAHIRNKALRLMKDPTLPAALQSFEQRQLVVNYKFGVLFAGAGQTTEQEYYWNTTHTEDFDNFLNMLGDRIELKGWKGYRGGLDVNSNSTGTHSVVASYHDLSVMFHVATLLPHFPSDAQQIERKRHLGNDIVMIVFQEGDKPFSPNSITSEFNQIFIVVRKAILDDGESGYQVSVVSDNQIIPFAPMIPDPPVFKSNSLFRNWLLCKAINGEHAAYVAPSIATRVGKARGIMLEGILSEYYK